MVKIFCDSDGVVFDFESHVMKYSGGVHPNKLGDDPLWNLIESIPDFWLTMPLFPWAHDLINFLRPHGPTILTGCPKIGFDVAQTQKIEKYKMYFPDLPLITCLSKEKPVYITGVGDILIDDKSKNIKRWEAVGGKGILFKTYEQVIADLQEILEDVDG
jgi:hypothetical protein